MSKTAGKTAWIFPGQGAQKCGMGKDFYESFQTAKEIFDQASDLLNLDMKALCFEENERLDQTEYTQAALVTVCTAIAEILREKGARPDVTAGLSLGEYCAIVEAGGMRFSDAASAVRQRGILMQNAMPDKTGSMAAVIGMEAEKIEEVLAGMGGVSIANYNCPGQIVITGYTESVEKAAQALREKGARKIAFLKVSGAFHSPMMQKAGEALKEVLAPIELTELVVPYLTNVTADYVKNSDEIKPLLCAQVASSVRWQQSMEKMIADGVDTFIEIGPGKTLAGFLRKIDRSVKVINISCCEDLKKLEGIQ